jgi:YVTN family beta-propeller protein
MRSFNRLRRGAQLAAAGCICIAGHASADSPKAAKTKVVTPYLHVPAVNDYARHDPNGVTIIPEGRYLTPIGRSIPVAQWPHGLVLSPDEKTAFVASSGVGQLITGWDTADPKTTLVSPDAGGTRRSKGNAGAAVFSPDGSTLYWSSGDSGAIHVFRVNPVQKVGEISLNTVWGGRKYEDSYAMDMKLSSEGKTIYCADVTNFRVVAVDIATNKVCGSVTVGRYPYALTVVGKHVYVANVGMFEYSKIPDPEPGKGDKRGLKFPPFAFPSTESAEGVEVEGRKVPGLGDPNVPEAFSVWGIDAAQPGRMKVTRRIKTGLLVGAQSDAGGTVGGSAPNYLAASGKNLYVSNNNNDIIERIDLATGKPAAMTRIVPSPLVAKIRGVNPDGMAISPNGKRLYVAEAALNAIAVLNTTTGKVIGHIPTPWYPYRLAITKDGKKLLCISFRGFGNGPAGAKNPVPSAFLGMKGALTVCDVPGDAELAALTKKVLTNNGLVDSSADRAKMSSPVIPTIPGSVSKEIKYVVFITKENHTYDAIFDHIAGANDDPSLLRWGLHQKIVGPGQPTLEDAAVMTNHNALARQFTVSDNFYMEPEASGVGHRWLVGVQPNNFCQMTYTLGWNFKLNTTAPGRLASFGSNGSIAPEDYPEAGSMWEHLARHKVSFRNYGEGFEFAGVDEGEHNGKTGAREVINMPMSKVLWDNTCREFPIFNMNIPDQYRADWFAKDFTKLFIDAGKPMPSFVNIAICNDHGTGPKPSKGYPYTASWMADNDLALGRIVDFLSHTKYWKNMAIFVTQDDSGGDPDHVDKQRSVLLVISPWAKRANVSHRHTTIVSMHRTLYQIFGLPPLNLCDAVANDFSDCFATTPDYTPYKVVPVDKRVFDPAKAIDPKDPDYERARLMPGPIRDADDPE